jgi:transposase
MEPPLVDVDLRDYMWVTRDRLGSTMSGMTMVPAIVRSVLKKVLSELGDAAGRKEIQQLQPMERSILAQQLVSHAERSRGEVKAFRALMEISEIEEQFAAEFKAVVARIPNADLSPALAVDIVTTASKSNALGKVCKSIIAENQDGKAPFEKALKQKKR